MSSYPISSLKFSAKTPKVNKNINQKRKTVIQVTTAKTPWLYGSIWDPGTREGKGLLQESPTGPLTWTTTRDIRRSPISKKKERELKALFLKHMKKRLTEIFQLTPPTLKAALDVARKGNQEKAFYGSLHYHPNAAILGRDEQQRPLVAFLEPGVRPCENSSAAFSLRSLSPDPNVKEMRRVTEVPNHVGISKYWAAKNPDFNKYFHQPALEYAKSTNQYQQTASNTENAGLQKIMMYHYLRAKAKETGARDGLFAANRVIQDTLARIKANSANSPLPDDLRDVEVSELLKNYDSLVQDQPLSQIKDHISDTAPPRYPRGQHGYVPVKISIQDLPKPQQ